RQRVFHRGGPVAAAEAALPHLDRHGQARDGGGVQDVRGGAVESLPNRVRLCRLLLGSILLLSRGFARLWCLWIHRPLLNLPAVRHRPHALGSSTSRMRSPVRLIARINTTKAAAGGMISQGAEYR